MMMTLHPLVYVYLSATLLLHVQAPLLESHPHPPSTSQVPKNFGTHEDPSRSYSTGQRVVERLVRVGSRPPSCYNKCRKCTPCVVVQVPAPPRNRHHINSFPTGEMDSNYKPMGWKCKCGHRLFNP